MKVSEKTKKIINLAIPATVENILQGSVALAIKDRNVKPLF